MTANTPSKPGADALEMRLKMARQLVLQSRWEMAERSYFSILESNPDNAETLKFLAARAVSRSDLASAARLLENGLDSRDPELHKHLGMVYQGQGNTVAALVAYRRAVELRPDAPVALLLLGELLHNTGMEHEALVALFRAVTAAQNQGRWLNDETTPPEYRERVKLAMQVIDQSRHALFSRLIEPLRERHGQDELRRVDKALAIYTGLVPANYAHPLQRPKFLYFPDLPTSEFFDRGLFPWMEELEANTEQVGAELREVLASDGALQPFLELRSEREAAQYLQGNQGKPAWDAFFFHRHGQRYDENCRRCPGTAALLDRLPLVRIADHAPEALFSVLSPGSHILPHQGVTNTRVVCHLPLIVPDQCAIRVGGVERAWKLGEAFAFDDTFEHEAWNRSGQTRVVMLMDIWNPYLTEIERDAVDQLVVGIGRFNQECGKAAES